MHLKRKKNLTHSKIIKNDMKRLEKLKMIIQKEIVSFNI